MSRIRTTISMWPAVYAEARSRYRHLGFRRLGDLISTAVHQYLQQQELEEKHNAMREAAADPQYRKLLRDVSKDFELIDRLDVLPESR